MPWSGRWLWLWGGLALFVLYTLFGFFVVPRIIASQIRSQARTSLQREASTRSVRFNPFTLTTAIEGLELSDRDGADLLTVDLFRANLEISGILRRAVRFKDVRIERPFAAARILADGKPSVADLFEPADEEDSEPFTLPRLIIDRLVLAEGVVDFTDAAREPAYESRFEPLNLDITDLTTIPDEGGAHTITIGVGETELRWKGQQTVEPLSFTGRLEVAGLDLQRVWSYAGSGQAFDIAGGRADVTLPYAVKRGDDRQIHATLDGASATVRSLAVRPRDEDMDWLTVPELQVANIEVAWPASRVDVERVQVTNPRVVARIEQDGALNWSRMQPQETATAEPGGSDQWTYRLASLEIDGGGVSFEDLSADPGVNLEIADIAARVERISSDMAAPIPFTTKARVAEQGAIDAVGTIAPSPLAASVKLTTSGIDLVPLRPYIKTAPGARIGAGTAALQAQITVSGSEPTLSLSANGAVDNVELHDLRGERVVAWQHLAIDGLTLEQPPDRLRVKKLTFDQAFAAILIDREGNLNLTALATAPPGATQSEGSTSSRTVEVGVVEFRNATADFADDSLPLPFRAKIHSANGTIRDISSFASAPATLAVEGRVDETGYVKTDGTLRLSNPMAASEVRVEFRSIEMPGLTPYFADFAGYAVRKGVLDLDVRYTVRDRRLIGNHTVVAKDLVLGDRVETAKAAPLPIRLAIALLKDREGRINLEIPVEGTVDSPDFAYRKVFWSAVRTILANAALAPFRALGRLFGRDEEDLELVEFDPGRSDLLPADQATLTRLAEQIGPRQDLTLTIEGRFDPKADTPALKRAKLEQLIESRRQAASEAAAAAGASTLETILEGLYTEQFSAEALQAERAKFTTAPPAAAPPAAAPPASQPAAAAPAEAAPADAAFDAARFYESLRARLLDAQSVTETELSGLATSRATTIASSLTGSGHVEASRVKVLESAQVKRQKRGSTRIASEMQLSAGADSESEQ